MPALPSALVAIPLARSLPGDYGFDPLNLGEDKEALKWFVQAELIHARTAMAAVAGILIPGVSSDPACRPARAPVTQNSALHPNSPPWHTRPAQRLPCTARQPRPAPPLPLTDRCPPPPLLPWPMRSC